MIRIYKKSILLVFLLLSFLFVPFSIPKIEGQWNPDPDGSSLILIQPESSVVVGNPITFTGWYTSPNGEAYAGYEILIRDWDGSCIICTSDTLTSGFTNSNGYFSITWESAYCEDNESSNCALEIFAERTQSDGDIVRTAYWSVNILSAPEPKVRPSFTVSNQNPSKGDTIDYVLSNGNANDDFSLRITKPNGETDWAFTDNLDSSGSASGTITFYDDDPVGTWELKLSSPDSEWNSYVIVIELTADTISTSISLDGLPYSVTEGDRIDISGRLTQENGQGLSGTIQIKDTSGNLILSGSSNSNGNFDFDWYTPEVNSDTRYCLQAHYPGSGNYLASTSSADCVWVDDTPEPVFTRPTLTVNEGTFERGETLIISVIGTPDDAVNIWITDPNNNKLSNRGGILDSSGMLRTTYSFTDSDPIGIWEIRVTSGKGVWNDVVKDVDLVDKTVYRSFTISTSEDEFNPGDLLQVSGTSNSNSDITFKVFNPNGAQVVVGQTTADSQGYYNVNLLRFPDTATSTFPFGSYRIVAATNQGTTELLVEYKNDQIPTRLTLSAPSEAEIGSTITFTGRLTNSDNGQGIAGGLIIIRNMDIAQCNRIDCSIIPPVTTTTSGRFSASWTVPLNYDPTRFNFQADYVAGSPGQPSNTLSSQSDRISILFTEKEFITTTPDKQQFKSNEQIQFKVESTPNTDLFIIIENPDGERVATKLVTTDSNGFYYVDGLLTFPSVCSSTFPYGYYTIRTYSGTNANPNNLNDSFRIRFTDSDGNLPLQTLIDVKSLVSGEKIEITVDFTGNLCKFDHWALSFDFPFSISNNSIIMNTFDVLGNSIQGFYTVDGLSPGEHTIYIGAFDSNNQLIETEVGITITIDQPIELPDQDNSVTTCLSLENRIEGLRKNIQTRNSEIVDLRNQPDAFQNQTVQRLIIRMNNDNARDNDLLPTLDAQFEILQCDRVARAEEVAKAEARDEEAARLEANREKAAREDPIDEAAREEAAREKAASEVVVDPEPRIIERIIERNNEECAGVSINQNPIQWVSCNAALLGGTAAVFAIIFGVVRFSWWFTKGRHTDTGQTRSTKPPPTTKPPKISKTVSIITHNNSGYATFMSLVWHASVASNINRNKKHSLTFSKNDHHLLSEIFSRVEENHPITHLLKNDLPNPLDIQYSSNNVYTSALNLSKKKLLRLNAYNFNNENITKQMNKITESRSHGNLLNVKLVNDRLLSSIFDADKFVILIDSQSLLDANKIIELDYYFVTLITLIQNYQKTIRNNDSISVYVIMTKFDLLKNSKTDIKDTLKPYLPNTIAALNRVSEQNMNYMKSYIQYPFDYSQEDYHSFLTWLPEN